MPNRWNVLARRTAFAIALAGLTLPATVALARKAAAGQPAFKRGDPEAVFIWHDAQGWHLRTTNGGKQHAFRGVVRPFSGVVEKLHPTRAALARKVRSEGTSISFEYDMLDPGPDGFDWDAAAECMTFELRIDNREPLDRIHIGARGESPSGIPFDACR